MTTSDARSKLLTDRLAELLDDAARKWLEEARAEVGTQGFGWLEVWFASLPRRVGTRSLGAEIVELSGRSLDLGARRICDLAAADLLRAAALSAEELERLFEQGDTEERRMVLSSLPLLDVEERGLEAVAARLLVAVHRTNDGMLFEVAQLDSNLPAAVLGENDWNNVVMKAAFLDMAAERLYGREGRANAELSSMLLDFLAEREAAGRPVWGPSLELCALAPVPGVVERVLGDLWHGVDRRRLAAARAAGKLIDDTRVADAVKARRPFETHPRVLEELPG